MSTQTGSPAPRRWLIAMPTAIVILLGALWSGFWYWSSSKAQASLTAWRAHEAEVGRHFDCANTAFGGFPFRIEVACTEPTVEDRRFRALDPGAASGGRCAGLGSDPRDRRSRRTADHRAA